MSVCWLVRRHVGRSVGKLHFNAPTEQFNIHILAVSCPNSFRNIKITRELQKLHIFIKQIFLYIHVIVDIRTYNCIVFEFSVSQNSAVIIYMIVWPRNIGNPEI